jgi:hypothetical protein
MLPAPVTVTLLLALTNEYGAYLLADRRITVVRRMDGRETVSVEDDEFNKLTMLFSTDARLAVAFTGLATAYAGGQRVFDTQEWLAQTLGEVSKTHPDLDGLLSALQPQAEQTFAAFNIPTTFLFVGFRYGEGPPERTVGTLSSVSKTGPPFTPHFVPVTSRSSIHVEGTMNAFDAKAREPLERILRTAAPHGEVVRTAVGRMRKAATDKRSAGVVGAQCNSLFVPRDVDTTIIGTYHSAHLTNVAYGANIVTAFGGIAIPGPLTSSGVMAGPEIGRKQPCWCGSGRRYKDCHLRTFGSTTLRLPQFSRPLFPTYRGEWKNPHASGRVWCVQNGFD